MESKNKILFKTALLSLVTAGGFLFIITFLKDVLKSHPSLSLVLTFCLALGFVLAAMRVIYTVYLVSVSKRFLLGYETSLESLQVLNTRHFLLVIFMLLPFMFIFSNEIMTISFSISHISFLFAYFSIQDWVTRIHDYRYRKIYLRYVAKYSK